MTTEQEIRKFLLTNDDIIFILNNRILDRFFIMYASEQLNEGGERDKLLQYQLIQICKAFFFPTSIYMHKPHTAEQQKMQKSASFNTDASEKYNEEKIVAQCNKHFLTQILKLKGISKDVFYDQLKNFGYARRLDILVKYFNIDIQKLLTILYTVIIVNAKNINNQSPK